MLFVVENDEAAAEINSFRVASNQENMEKVNFCFNY